MGLWGAKMMADKKKANTCENNIENESSEANLITSTVTKEIDWEERHFQICLALLSRSDITCNGGEMRGIIRKADMMVELLKERHLEPAKETPDSETPEPATETAGKEDSKKKGRHSWGHSMQQNMRFQKIWSALQELGYTNGSDIPFFHFNECCENLNIDADSIDLVKFSEKFDVNIG